MLYLNLNVEAHDFQHNLHYSIKLPQPMDFYTICPEYLKEHFDFIEKFIIEEYKRDMVKNKFHLKLVK